MNQDEYPLCNRNPLLLMEKIQTSLKWNWIKTLFPLCNFASSLVLQPYFSSVFTLHSCSFYEFLVFIIFFFFWITFQSSLLCHSWICILYPNCLHIVMQRNYRFFFMFVFSTTLLCIYVFAFCWVYIVRIMAAEETTIWKAMIKTPASIVLIIYTFISMWFVGGLTAFHLYLISTNQVSTALFNPHA